jgi:hypothetical protein
MQFQRIAIPNDCEAVSERNTERPLRLQLRRWLRLLSCDVGHCCSRRDSITVVRITISCEAVATPKTTRSKRQHCRGKLFSWTEQDAHNRKTHDDHNTPHCERGNPIPGPTHFTVASLCH